MRLLQVTSSRNVTEQEAREIANKREQLQREQGLRTQKRLTLGDISHRIARGEFHELNVIVKGDTDGSVEALSDSFIKLSTEKVQVNVVNKAVGQISENDVMLASASDAVIVGFQVRPSADARKAADREGVEINTYSIIYDAIDDIKSAMVGETTGNAHFSFKQADGVKPFDLDVAQMYAWKNPARTHG